ncbi:hypothetical protein SDC9_129584 [bioreactor metagenome]|uniref:Uncharacterized protein n=1 Tax=bioreactor metagenome TaxID=1076179 RepID=A0A645D097_9ZZZZ
MRVTHGHQWLCALSASSDLDVIQPRCAGRIFQFQIAQHLAQHRGHHQIAVGLGVGGHNGPGRPWRVRGSQQPAVGLLVVVPLGAHLEVVLVELPVLAGVVQPLLQPLALFVLADVQHELDDHRAGLAEHALEVVDLRIALGLLLGREPAVDHGHQHILVLAAVEEHDLARTRHLLVNAPQVVVGLLHVGGRLPAHGAHAQRRHATEDSAQRAVLAGCVHALQYDQQLEAPVGVEQVLQRVQLLGQGFDTGPVLGLAAAREGLGAGIEPGQLAASGLDGSGARLQGLPAFAQRGIAAGEDRLRHGRRPSLV